jgi:hypothetical protein
MVPAEISNVEGNVGFTAQGMFPLFQKFQSNLSRGVYGRQVMKDM